MPPEDYQKKAKDIVIAYIHNHFEVTDPVPDFEVYVVWFSKTLQNWKALLSSTLPDQMYYEITYDGEKKRAYLDAYKKFNNMVIPDHIVSEQGHVCSLYCPEHG